MKVVTSQAGLDRLAHYAPRLKILTLDGSCVSSLRDLGSSLKSLTTLSVVRCNLETLDGIWGFENLQQLLARDNFVTNPSPCSGARKLVKLDLANNDISDVSWFLFLRACVCLRDLGIARNNFDEYADTIRAFLPQVRVLDGQVVETIQGGAVTDEGSSGGDGDGSSLSDDADQKDDPRDSEYSKDSGSLSRFRDSVKVRVNLVNLPRRQSVLYFVKRGTRDDDRPFEVSRWETDNSRIKLDDASSSKKLEEADGPSAPIYVIPDQPTAISVRFTDAIATNVDEHAAHEVPSKLTAGRVVCGNLAASLRTRNPTRNVFTLPQARIEELQ